MISRRANSPPAEGRITFEAIICPSGITKIKIDLNPTNQQPLPNICPWGNKKKNLQDFGQSALHDDEIRVLSYWLELVFCLFFTEQ